MEPKSSGKIGRAFSRLFALPRRRRAENAIDELEKDPLFHPSLHPKVLYHLATKFGKRPISLGELEQEFRNNPALQLTPTAAERHIQGLERLDEMMKSEGLEDEIPRMKRIIRITLPLMRIGLMSRFDHEEPFIAWDNMEATSRRQVVLNETELIAKIIKNRYEAHLKG